MEMRGSKEDLTENSVASKIMRRLRNWRESYIPIALSLFCIILIIATTVGMAVKMNKLISDLSALELRVDTGVRLPQAQMQLQQKDVGSVYTRWGRNACPAGTEQVYQGFAAGSSSEAQVLPGGGANLLCMPQEPEWNKYDLKNDSYAYGWLYAAELMSFDDGIYDDDVHGFNAACSVCRAPRATKLMIPGRTSCPDTWTMEYYGYLMSSHVSQHKLTFECFDAKPDVIGGTRNITGGAMLFFISGYCEGPGSLEHCPPYVHGRELTCVMCTK